MSCDLTANGYLPTNEYILDQNGGQIGQPIAEKTANGSWSDYIYANGRKIAESSSADQRLHVTGYCPANGQCIATWQLSNTGGYTIKQGDTLYLRQYEDGGGYGGINITFTDGTQTAWNSNDSVGQRLCGMTTQNQWVNRSGDLSVFANKTISNYYLMLDQPSLAGNFDLYFGDIAIVSQDGTVTPIYAGQQGVAVPLAYNSNNTATQLNAFAENAPGAGPYPYVTHYYHTDQIGSTRLITSAAGWPISSDTFYPFGQEQAPNVDSNHYKFTSNERDAESGLDYFGARYYASNMGRFMSPDWADKPEAVPYSDLSNPQSLNLYGYVNNNPLSKADPDGHCPFCAVVVEKLEEGAVGGLIGAGVNVGITALTNPNATRSDYIGAAESGFITGSVAGLTGGGSLAVQVGVNAVANVVGGVVERSTAAGHLDVGSAKDVATDAVIGAAGPVLAKGFGKAAQAINGKDAEALGKAAEGTHLGDRHSASLKRQAAAASAFDEFGRKAGDRTGQVIDGANRANDNLNKDKKDHQ